MTVDSPGISTAKRRIVACKTLTECTRIENMIVACLKAGALTTEQARELFHALDKKQQAITEGVMRLL